jgi:hypothetical protein
MNLYEMSHLVSEVDEWLDSSVSAEYKAQPLAQDWARISKVAEELGEAIDAYILTTGQNPRKGQTDSLPEVLNELADVAFTAILAIQHFTKDSDLTVTILTDKIAMIYARMRDQQ